MFNYYIIFMINEYTMIIRTIDYVQQWIRGPDANYWQLNDFKSS